MSLHHEDIDLGGFVLQQKTTSKRTSGIHDNIDPSKLSSWQKGSLVRDVLEEAGAEAGVQSIEWLGGEAVKFSGVKFADPKTGNMMTMVYDLDGNVQPESFSIHTKERHPKIIGGPEWSVLPAGDRPKRGKIEAV